MDGVNCASNCKFSICFSYSALITRCTNIGIIENHQESENVGKISLSRFQIYFVFFIISLVIKLPTQHARSVDKDSVYITYENRIDSPVLNDVVDEVMMMVFHVVVVDRV